MIEDLDLSGCNNLNDACSEHIKNLTELKKITFGDSKITGQLFHSLGLLTNLTELSLQDCHLSIYDLDPIKSLKSVSIRGMRLANKKIPFNLPNLTHLDLIFCRHPDFGFLPDLRALTYLSLNSCREFSDSDLIGLSHLEKLQEVCIRHGKITSAGVEKLEAVRKDIQIYNSWPLP
jgi:Leucine-rich repeat (LRR) protein